MNCVLHELRVNLCTLEFAHSIYNHQWKFIFDDMLYSTILPEVYNGHTFESFTRLSYQVAMSHGKELLLHTSKVNLLEIREN
jgi:hypothetical protein